MILSVYHPQQFIYAASLSGFLNRRGFVALPDQHLEWVTPVFQGQRHVGPTEDPNSGWKRNDPMVQIPALVANNTRLWCTAQRTAQRAGGGDVPAKFLEGLTIRTTGPSRQLHSRRWQERGLQLPRQRHAHWAYWASSSSR